MREGGGGRERWRTGREEGGFKKNHIGENNQLINDLGHPLFNKQLLLFPE